MLVSSLCHDVDHRGTTNSFQLASNSVLAVLYSFEGSVMERHNFAQKMCFLNAESCNIFRNLSSSDYTRKSFSVIIKFLKFAIGYQNNRIFKTHHSYRFSPQFANLSKCEGSLWVCLRPEPTRPPLIRCSCTWLWQQRIYQTFGVVNWLKNDRLPTKHL